MSNDDKKTLNDKQILSFSKIQLLSILRSDWLSYYWAICYSPLVAKSAAFLAAKKD